MIGFSFAYIFFCLIIVIGVIFLIHGLSQKPQKRILQPAYDEDLENGTTKQLVYDPQLQQEGTVAKYDGPEIPERFDPDYIQNQVMSIRNSPNMISAYFARVEARFRTSQEMKIIAMMKGYNKLIADGIASEVEIYQRKTDLAKVIGEWKREERESFQQLKDQDEEEKIKASIAESRSKRAEHEAKIKQYEGQSQKPANSKPTPEEVRKRRNKEFDVKAEDMMALDETRKKHLNNLERRMKEELEDLEDDLWSDEEKERKEDEIYSRYAKLRKEILTMKPRRG